MESSRFSRIFLILLLAFISLAFVAMIRGFLLTILLAAIFAGLLQPFYQSLSRRFGNRRSLASLVTLVLFLLLILVPFLLLLGIVAAEAINVTRAVGPWISTHLQQPDELMEILRKLPGFDKLEPYRDVILKKAGEFVGFLGNFLVNSLSATTRGTAGFFFQFFIFLYTLFFFLKDGGKLLNKILYYVPLDDSEEQLMVGRFVSVTKATIKGTLLIGLIQGSLAGLALWIAGVQGAIFWGAIMTVLSIIPGIGTALVWFPAALILFAMGKVWQPIFLILFCGLVVGSIDNILRPTLVGRDTQMHDLLILFSTLGGIMLFGVTGFIIGPILAALFVTIWDIYGQVFKNYLPPVGGSSDRAE